MEKIRKSGKAALGFVFLLVGGFMLAGNMGLVPHEIYHSLFRWPSILILIGIFHFIKRDFTPGIILSSIGVFFLMPHLIDSFNYGDVFTFWPVLLIVVGVVFIFGKQSYNKGKYKVSGNKDEIIEAISIFGGGVTKIDSDNFKGGEITCIFGGEEVNLQDAKMSEEGAVIEMTTVFGGTKITVPRDWNVKVEVVSIFGGFADKRMYASDNPSGYKTLIIKGTAIFGGGELRNF